MKRSQYFVFILIVLALCLSIYFFINQNHESSIILITFKSTEKVKLNEKIEPIDLIASTNSTKIIYPKIDTSTPGIKELTYTAIGTKGEHKEFMKKIFVLDPVPPVLELKKYKVAISIGEHFNANDFIKKAEDNLDGKLKVDISNNYNVQKPGTYKISFMIMDSSDNKATKTLVLLVKAKKQIDKKNHINSKESEINNKKKEESKKPNRKPDKTSPNKGKADNYNGKTTWMFNEGYTFDNALKKCRVAAASSNRNASCNVIQDSKGIYIGYKLNLH